MFIESNSTARIAREGVLIQQIFKYSYQLIIFIRSCFLPETMTFFCHFFLIKTSLKTNEKFFANPTGFFSRFFFSISFFLRNIIRTILGNDQFVALCIYIVHAKQVFAF